MTSVEAYLDQACARLRVNPAEADDIREELSSHLAELIESYRAEGMGRREATERACACFGAAGKLHHSLDRVHRGDPWWVSRLKGLGVGAFLGGALALLLPVGGHLEFLVAPMAGFAALDPTRLHVVLNALLVGGVIGVFSAGGRSLFVGWMVGSLIWLTEYVVYWVMSVTSGTILPDGGLGLMNSVLLAPVVGGMFGVAVGAGSAALVSLTSGLRPEIR